MPSQTPRITGLLFNCAMNCALPRLLENIDRLATLEQEGNLPEANDPTYAHYERLKTIFMTLYGQHDHANCTWEFFSNFLKKYSFYGQEIMFAPVFRIFIGEQALKIGERYAEDVWHIREIQSPKHPSAEFYNKYEGDNPEIGHYSLLDIARLTDLFYAPLAIGNVRLYEPDTRPDAPNDAYIQSNTYARPLAAMPTWLGRDTDDDSFSMYVRQDHYELLPHTQLDEPNAQYIEEIRLLPRGLAKVHGIISSSNSAEQASRGLAHLVLYVHDALENSLRPRKPINKKIDYNTYKNTTAEFHGISTGTNTDPETFARILLAVATRTSEFKTTASRLLNMPHLSPELVALLVNQAHDLEAPFRWVDAQTEKLLDAVIHHKRDQARQAIAAGADVNQRIVQTNERGEQTETTLLNIVARSKPDNDKMADILIGARADMGALDAKGNTPLLNAIAVGNVKFAHTYMEQLRRIKPDRRAAILEHKVTRGDSSYTALVFAIRRSFSTLAITMIQAGANPNPTGNTASPLHMACMLLGYASVESQYAYAPLDLITTLLDHGAEAPENLFDYLTVDSAPPDELFKLIDDRNIQLGRDSNRRHTYLSSEAYDKIHQPKIQQALERRMQHEPARNQVIEPAAEESKTRETSSASRINQPSPAAQGIFSPPTPAVTEEQRAVLKAKFKAVCDNMIEVLNELQRAGKIDEETLLDLRQKIGILHDHPGNHQAFLRSMQQCEYLVGSKFLAYCMLAAGYAAKLCTFGYYGENWIEQANQKLAQIQVVAKFEAEGEAFYPPSAR